MYVCKCTTTGKYKMAMIMTVRATVLADGAVRGQLQLFHAHIYIHAYHAQYNRFIIHAQEFRMLFFMISFIFIAFLFLK